MGKITLTVSMLGLGKFPSDSNKDIFTPEIFENGGNMCRFCFGEHDTNTNPLLSICKCNGTLKYIHYNCIRKWLKYQMAIITEKEVTSYHWKSFECELCKTCYPSICNF